MPESCLRKAFKVSLAAESHQVHALPRVTDIQTFGDFTLLADSREVETMWTDHGSPRLSYGAGRSFH